VSESSMEETWLSIPGYEGLYEASTYGQIRRIGYTSKFWNGRVGHVLKSHDVNEWGHQSVSLSRDGKVKQLLVHRLVKETFTGPCPPGQEVRHLDGNPRNNRLDNLVYGTPSENIFDSVGHGTHYNARKTHCIHGHEYNAENTSYYTKKNGGSHRVCQVCRREREGRD
jgi:hypothetical protein